MNKIYKVIWSKVRNCYVAVSEIAKRNGKSCTSVNCGAKANRGHAGMALALALSLSMAGGGIAWGADVHGANVIISDETYKNSVVTMDPGATLTVDTTGKVGVIQNAISSNGQTIIVKGDIVNTISSGGIKFSIIAGGNNNRLNITGSVAGNVYGGDGGSNASVTGNSIIIGNGGNVGGNVYGGRSESGTVGGSSTGAGNYK